MLEDEDRKRVLLLLDHLTATHVAIERASMMSDALDARLHVVHSIPSATATQHPALMASHVIDFLRARSPRHGYDVEIVNDSIERIGDEVTHIRDIAMVIVGERIGARAACRLATKLQIPVLVARDHSTEGEWIAASDMQHLDFPVLAIARDVTAALDREVLYFHNASPVPVIAGDPMAGPASYVGMLELQEVAAAAKSARLEELAREDERAHSVVTRSGSTVEALIDLVRERGADAIVVGTHPRSWWSRLLGRGKTEKLVERSPRSVLIVPLDGSV